MTQFLNLELPLLEQVEAVAKLAGDAIMDIYQQDFAVYTKNDQSPLTEADLLANRIISQKLAALTPDTPLLSEESAEVPWQTRRGWREYWLIDPIDGTKEFIKKNGEFTVNIALIRDGEPVLGVVYSPAIDEMHSGIVGLGAFKEAAGQRVSIQCRPLAEGETCIAMGSKSHPTKEAEEYLAQFGNCELTPAGSSLKFCRIAEGSAHVYPRFGPTCEWDTGAAHAVLRAAGGEVYSAETWEPLRYNQKESLLNPFFVGKGWGGREKGKVKSEK